MVAPPETIDAANGFQDQHSGDDRQGDENSEPGLQSVFHNLPFISFDRLQVGPVYKCLKSACRNFWIKGSGLRLTSSGVPMNKIRPSLMTAMRSATPKARSRSWETTREVTWMRSFKLIISSPMITADSGSSSLVGSS